MFFCRATEWLKSWNKGDLLVRIGMVAMPSEAMRADAAKVRDMTLLPREVLAES